jgi:hypothetical protein
VVEVRVDRRETAVDDQRGAGDPGGVGRGEEGDGRGDVLRFADPAQGVVRTVPGATRLTRTPRAAACPARVRVRETKPAFAAL